MGKKFLQNLRKTISHRTNVCKINLRDFQIYIQLLFWKKKQALKTNFHGQGDRHTKKRKKSQSSFVIFKQKLDFLNIFSFIKITEFGKVLVRHYFLSARGPTSPQLWFFFYKHQRVFIFTKTHDLQCCALPS